MTSPFTPEHTRIGFIGAGVMGSGMMRRLMAGGYAVSVYSRTRSKADALIQDGAIWRDSPAELARHSNLILTIVGYPSDVEAVYFGPDGLIENAVEGTVLVDMTTSQPALAVRIADAARARNLQTLDAPVSGGDIGARNGTLSIMVGGEEAVFEAVRPVLEQMGQTIHRQGPAGAGQHTKMCNQIVIAGAMLGLCESMAYAKRSGLNPNHVLDSIQGGAAGSWALTNLAPRIIQGDFDPGFFIKHFVKDMDIALKEAESLGLDARGLALAREQYGRLMDAGDGDLGTQALYRLYEETHDQK